MRVSTLRPGDFFGEMSLFDRKPRSATATAVVDSRIIKIGGDAFMSVIAKTPQMALKVLAEIASRVRHTDETVRELADKVYREAYSAVQAKVCSELDSIKTIYQKTEERASQTLERAAQTVGHLEWLWSLLLRTIPVVGLALVVLAFFGIKSFNDVKTKVDEVNKWHDDVAKEGLQVKNPSAAAVRRQRPGHPQGNDDGPPGDSRVGRAGPAHRDSGRPEAGGPQL